MKYKIVSDSSSNLHLLSGVAYESVPLKIRTQTKEYVDDARLDVAQMVEEIKKQGGRSGTSCPNTQEWLDAFEGADAIFALCITSKLSGSYSAAMQAREEYIAAHADAKICVLNTLSTGPEMQLIIEKLRDMIAAGEAFEAIEEKIKAYLHRTHLIFALKSLTNLARNGRVSHASAAVAGALNICVVGKASEDGVLEQIHKCRGEKRVLKTILASMRQEGYAGGKVRIDHCLNPDSAAALRDLLLETFPGSDIRIGECGGLCSYYAEKGGFIIGFEDGM